MTRPSVSIIVNTYNQARFLDDSLGSCLDQGAPATEVLVVDDGSTLDDPTEVVTRFPGVRLIRQANQGLSAARNTGLANASGEFILFLDADDRLTPQAVSAGLGSMAANPQACLTYGAHRNIDLEGKVSSAPRFFAVGPDPALDFLAHGNLIGMHATVMYRREILKQTGGFDPALRACEDYDLFLRLSGVAPFASHGVVVAEYRKHGDQMSGDHMMMEALALEVIRRQLERRDDKTSKKAAAQGRRNIRRLYTLAAFRAAGLRLVKGRSRRGDLAQAARCFFAFPVSATGVLVEHSRRLVTNDRTRPT